MTFDPATELQNYLVFGEFGDVNPSICDSSTYTFLSVGKMEELFEHEIEGCFLYSRHWNPTNKALATALACMESGESAQVMASGMAAISTTLLQLCSSGDEIVCSRAAGILKNLHTLHVRIRRHSENALLLAQRFQEAGITVHYPGLPGHPHHGLMTRLMNPGFGYGGIVAVDVGDQPSADRLMERMQEQKVGYLAVSLGYFKTLFSAPGHSTSSEIPPEERQRMGMGDGLIRFSVGLDNDIERTWRTISALLVAETTV